MGDKRVITALSTNRITKHIVKQEDAAFHDKALVPQHEISNLIYSIRGQQVMLDRDLAKLYGIETRTLKQAVMRNSEKFPDDFLFILSQEESKSLIQTF